MKLRNNRGCNSSEFELETHQLLLSSLHSYAVAWRQEWEIWLKRRCPPRHGLNVEALVERLWHSVREINKSSYWKPLFLSTSCQSFRNQRFCIICRKNSPSSKSPKWGLSKVKNQSKVTTWTKSTSDGKASGLSPFPNPILSAFPDVSSSSNSIGIPSRRL